MNLQATGEAQALRQAHRHAQAREGARAMADDQATEVRPAQPSLLQHGLGHGQQL